MIVMMVVVMIMIVMVKIVMVIATMMLATMLTKMEVGKKVVNKLLVGGRVFVMPIISLMNISMVLIFWLQQAVPDCVVPLALIQTVAGWQKVEEPGNWVPR